MVERMEIEVSLPLFLKYEQLNRLTVNKHSG